MLQFAEPLFVQNLAYAKRLVADLTDEQCTQQPLAVRELNHATFVLGHLAYVCDVGATLLGLPALHANMKDAYGMGAKPGTSGPAKAELLALYEAAHNRLVAAALAAKTELLQELPPERFRARFPTIGHVVLHLLTNHQAVHLGQLSAWRRALGLPAV